MRTHIPARTALVLAPLLLFAFFAFACGRKDQNTGGSTEQQKRAATVASLDTGRRINSAHQIEDGTEVFAPGDTLWASVKTEDTPAGTRILARWVYTEGDVDQIVTEETRTTANAGTGYSSFFAYNPTGWPTGSYEIRIGLDGEMKKTKEIHVKA